MPTTQIFVKYFKFVVCSNIFVLVLCFQVLAEKVHIKALTIAQRVSLLQEGLHDTSGKWLSVCMILTFTLVVSLSFK